MHAPDSDGRNNFVHLLLLPLCWKIIIKKPYCWGKQEQEERLELESDRDIVRPDFSKCACDVSWRIRYMTRQS